jgi:anti-sigma28 factor (negative regulator of flagellin synthesis)
MPAMSLFTIGNPKVHPGLRRYVIQPQSGTAYMKIYDSNMSSVGANASQRSQETQQTDRSNAGRSSAADGGNGDRVEFSGTLGRLSRVLSTFQNDRSSRVQALAAQYQAGAYQPDSGATSRGLISEALSGGAEAGLQ